MHPASEAIIVGLRDLATLDDRVQGIIDAVQQLFDPRAEQEGMDDIDPADGGAEGGVVGRAGGVSREKEEGHGRCGDEGGIVPMEGCGCALSARWSSKQRWSLDG